MVFDIEKYTGFKDKRFLLLFLKQFFGAVNKDDVTRLSDALKVLYYHLDAECQIYFESFIKIRKDLDFICYKLANVFSSGPEGIQKVVHLVHCFIKTVNRKENNIFCFPLKFKKNKSNFLEKSVLPKNTVPLARPRPPSRLSSIPNHSNQRKVYSLNADPGFKGNEFKEVPEVGPMPPKRSVQDYYAIKKECLESHCLFKDPEFPANSSSLFYSYQSPKSLKKIKWLRPFEIVEDPHFFCDGYSRFDINQGSLGNCWFVAALANLTLHREAFYKVVNPQQSFSQEYAGIFHFKFLQYGKWIDVVVDDRLPTLEGKLMYLSSSDITEFWGALLEKAYAKLYGSYEALEGGWISEALGDMTGGLTEIIDIKSPSQNLLRIIFRGIKLGSLFGCSIIKKSSEAEGQPPYGLKNNHAYSITGMQIVKGPMGIPTPLIRIRNPWGDEQEWTGPWSDNSSEWDNVSLNQRININLKFENDGESWMPFDDFTKYFETLEICHIDPNIMKNVYHHNHPPSESHDTWSVQTFHGVWRRRVTAGGSLKYLQTYLLNPQYLISLDDSQHEDEDNSCTLIIGVLQKYRRELKHEGVQNLSINFALYEIEDNLDKKLDTDFFVRNEPIFESNPVFDGYLREITSRIRVPPGKYVIVPSTKERHEEANFMLRIFTDGIIESKELH